METGASFGMQKTKAMLCWFDWLLCQKVAFTAAWFPWTEIQCSRGHWSHWSSVYLSSKFSLWAQFYWVLLGCSQEIPVGTLWLYFWHAQSQCSKSPWISSNQDYMEMRALDDLLDGSLQGWKKCKGGSIWGLKKSMAHSSINHTVKSQRVWHKGLTNSVIIFLIW